MKSNPTCIHCGADCGKNPIIAQNMAFCCHGCEQVFLLLNEYKLNQYYTLTENPGIRVDNLEHLDKYAFLDHEEVKTKLYEFFENGLAKVTFYIPAIHCISCIWLLEHLTRLHQGIRHSSVHFSEKKVSISFQSTEISLRQLVELLVSIHYIPEITLETLEGKPVSKEDKSLLYKIGVAGFVFGNVMLFSLPQYFNGKPLEGYLSTFFNYASLILTLPLVFYSGSDYLLSAYKNLKKKIIVIDLPIALGVMVLFGVTLFEIISGTGQGYCDSLSGLLFFLLIGRWYQGKTYQALSFDRDYKSYFPVAVTKIAENSTQSILLKDLKVGDRLLIRNKELIPSDSMLISGEALIDYSFVSGESSPVKKEAGDFLYAGGIQTRGAITIEITREINQSHLTQLWNQSEEKAPVRKTLSSTIDQISGVFTIGVIAIAMAGFGWWWWHGQPHTAILVFTSVLIVTCPCALALSQPFTFGNAMRMLGLHGMYLKNVNVIEKLTQVDTVVFDKTGTITVPDKNSIHYFGDKLTEKELQAVFSLTKQSTHPLSNALAKHLGDMDPLEPEGFVEVSGRGIYAKIGDRRYKIGSEEYVSGTASVSKTIASAVFIAIDQQVRGHFIIGNQYREGVDQVMMDLSKHFELYLLSGDNDSEKENLKKYFIPENLFFEQKPQDKMNFISSLRHQGRNVLMTGDGLNDAGAFLQSNVGLSIADDIYHFSPAGDAIIESGSFKKLYTYILYARKSLNVVKISFIISFFYNVIGLIYALSGTMSPVVGAILMPISSVSVVAFATLSTRWLARNLSH